MRKFLVIVVLLSACRGTDCNKYKTVPNPHLEVKVGSVDMMVFTNKSTSSVSALVLWNEITQDCSSVDVGGVSVTTCNESTEKHSGSFTLKPKQTKKVRFNGELKLKFIKTCVLSPEAGEENTCVVKEY
jgi:hypothetical protein